MKSIIVFLFVLALSILSFSCKKDNNESQPSYPNYVKFNSGSYWIYQQFIVDSSGNATATNKFDSCFVQKDTLIKGLTYYKYHRPDPYNPYNTGYIYLRDSLHYIVTDGGMILFSSEDFQTVFDSRYGVVMGPDIDTIYHAITKMEDKDLSVATPAGIFITSDFRTTFNMYPKWSIAGNPRCLHNRYAENTGVVIETLPFMASLPTYIERRLVRYHIN